MAPSNLDPPTSVPDFVEIVEDGMKYIPHPLGEIKGVIAWCEKERLRMLGLVDELRTKLESDADDAEKLAEATKYLDQFELVMPTMKSELRDKHVVAAASLRKHCDIVILGCCLNIAGIAEANLAVASGLAEDVVGPIQATATLAKSLAKDFFEPALKAAESAEDAIAQVIAAVEKVRWPRGSDVQAILADTLRFKRELEALAGTFTESTLMKHLTTIQERMDGAKPIMELFDV